jgi:hypothetical protein
MSLFAALAVAGCVPERSGEPLNDWSQDLPAANAVANADTVAADASPARSSVFTPLDEASCRTIAENRNEGPYWRRQCPGTSGYLVEWTESDLRQGLEVAKDGREIDLRLSGLVANGAFNHLGPRIEWRGDNGSPPDRMVVRVLVADGAEPAKPDKSLLAVASLRPSPCLIAIIQPGPGQSEEARRIADGPSRPCLSG